MTDRVQRIRQALAGRYEIERELGSGGMATVYLARDLKHDRLVAMKVLHPELAASLGSERFLREIQVTAKLSHPHILPLYDSGNADGLLFYTMPFIEGESLHDFIKREKQLAIPEAVRIAREVAEGLAIAHSYGLVHRDIKPQNILLSGGHAVIADFGIATAVSHAQGEKLTQTGMSIGTPAYMSPEQASGLEVDGRSDIYSLGCVLYEMLVGQIPFTGPTPQAIIARHSLDQVPPPHIMRGTIPEELEEIILCALAKSPADRFRTAQEFADALMSLDSGTVPHRRLSRSAPVRGHVRHARLRGPILLAAATVAALAVGITGWWTWSGRRAPALDAGGLDARRVAVLYFEDLTADGDLRYLADGLTEGVIAQLAQVRGLNVVSQNGVARFRSADLPRDSIARALRAGTLILGSVEPVGGERLRVTTRLVDGGSGADFERASVVLPRADLLAIRDSAAGDIARLLRSRLGAEIQWRERRAGTTSAEAWALVQRAEKARKDAEERLGNHDSDGASGLLERADSLLAAAQAADPRWSEPPLVRARVAFRQAVLRQREPHEAMPWIERTRQHVARALALTPNDPRALELRGTADYFEYFMNVTPDAPAREQLLSQAKRDLEAAVATEPTLAGAHAMLSHLYYRFDDVVSATLAAQRAYGADEFLSNADVILSRLFWGSYDLAQFREARRWCREGARRFPDDYRFTECRLWMLTTPDAEPDVDLAWQLAARLDSLAPEHVVPSRRHLGRVIVGGVIGRTGQLDSADRVLERARPQDRHADPNQLLGGYEAAMRVLMGDTAEAITLLKRAVAVNPDHSFERGGNVHWWWLPLKDHPEFRKVVGERH